MARRKKNSEESYMQRIARCVTICLKVSTSRPHIYVEAIGEIAPRNSIDRQTELLASTFIAFSLPSVPIMN